MLKNSLENFMSKTRTPSWTAGILAVAAAAVLFLGGPVQAADDLPNSAAACPASLMWDAVTSTCR